MEPNFILNTFDPRGKGAVYRRIEASVIDAIRAGRIRAGERVPSVRTIARELGVSRTSAESALEALCGAGWIDARPKSGFYAADIPAARKHTEPVSRERSSVRFDFSGASVDLEAFPEEIWRRSLTRASKNRTALASYGDPQGEMALREALSRYGAQNRKISADPGRIVVGAGLMSLLQIHAALVSGFHHVHFLGQAYRQAEADYRDRGWEVTRGSLNEALTMRDTVLVVGPTNGLGAPLTREDRLGILHWVTRNNGHVLEDDYLGEFRTKSVDATSLQNLLPDARITYFGSFSRVLLPSTRVSFMVLPEDLSERWQSMRERWTQTAGTIEQLALSNFITQGHLRRHIHRLRQHYAQKNAQLAELLARHFPQARVSEGASLLQLELDVPDLAIATARENARKAGIVLGASEGSGKRLIVSASGISRERLEEAVKALAQAIGTAH